MSRIILLLLLSCVALPAFAHPAAVVASSGVQAVSSGAGASGDLALRWCFGTWWGVALTGRAGGVMSTHAGDPSHANHLLLGLLIGPVAVFPVGANTGHVALQIQHIHHASSGDWADHPLANLAGDSSGSVRHRSGVELSGGVSWPTSVTAGTWHLVLETDIAASLLPSSDRMAWAAGVRFGVGLASAN